MNIDIANSQPLFPCRLLIEDILYSSGVSCVPGSSISFSSFSGKTIHSKQSKELETTKDGRLLVPPLGASSSIMMYILSDSGRRSAEIEIEEDKGKSITICQSGELYQQLMEAVG